MSKEPKFKVGEIVDFAEIVDDVPEYNTGRVTKVYRNRGRPRFEYEIERAQEVVPEYMVRKSGYFERRFKR